MKLHHLVARTLLSGMYQILCHAASKPYPTDSVLYQPHVDESGWAEELVPAENDPEVARILDIIDKPEPWDHL